MIRACGCLCQSAPTGRAGLHSGLGGAGGSGQAAGSVRAAIGYGSATHDGRVIGSCGGAGIHAPPGRW